MQVNTDYLPFLLCSGIILIPGAGKLIFQKSSDIFLRAVFVGKVHIKCLCTFVYDFIAEVKLICVLFKRCTAVFPEGLQNLASRVFPVQLDLKQADDD